MRPKIIKGNIKLDPTLKRSIKPKIETTNYLDPTLKRIHKEPKCTYRHSIWKELANCSLPHINNNSLTALRPVFCREKAAWGAKESIIQALLTIYCKGCEGGFFRGKIMVSLVLLKKYHPFCPFHPYPTTPLKNKFDPFPSPQKTIR